MFQCCQPNTTRLDRQTAAAATPYGSSYQQSTIQRDFSRTFLSSWTDDPAIVYCGLLLPHAGNHVESTGEIMSSPGSSDQFHVTAAKFMCKLLRHGSDSCQLVIDSAGWVKWSHFQQVVRQQFPSLSEEDVKTIAETCPKSRFRFDAGRIAAWYGHSLPIEEFDSPVVPPEVLFHGTTVRAWPTIENQGLKPGKRLYVHLSKNVPDATLVGSRRKGKIIVLEVQATAAHQAGAVFYDKSNVYVTKFVAPEYLSVR
mgnify:CR=1 FL=1